MDIKYLLPTSIIDSDNENIIEYANGIINNCGDDPVLKAVKLYRAVRDDIIYDPYTAFQLPEYYRASNVLNKGRGFCVSKASLLCAVARACDLPSRVGFATVRNHLNVDRLVESLGSDLFIYHGYTEFYLNGKWLKSTPAFNKSVCKKNNVEPLEFNGYEDSIFQEYDSENNLFMEYVDYHGVYSDIPVDEIISACRKEYGTEKVDNWAKKF